jgi:hypothetical protein
MYTGGPTHREILVAVQSVSDWRLVWITKNKIKKSVRYIGIHGPGSASRRYFSGKPMHMYKEVVRPWERIVLPPVVAREGKQRGLDERKGYLFTLELLCACSRVERHPFTSEKGWCRCILTASGAKYSRKCCQRFFI